MKQLIEDLWDTRREIVSDGFDDALDYISKIIPLKIHKFPSGTKCWSWTIPKKWSVKEAYIEDMKTHKRIIDIKKNPLCVHSYSTSIDVIRPKIGLRFKITMDKSRPNSIKWKFHYYEKDWGFSIPYNIFKKLDDQTFFKVYIDSKHEKGNLKVGECIIKGKSKETIVLISHLCHPHMVNDDLSGVAVLVDVAKELLKKKNYYTYKILLVPETIGSIAYLHRFQKDIKDMKYCIFFEMLGVNNRLALQLSHQGNTKIDQIAEYCLKENGKYFKDKFPRVVGNDEKVFNSPGINIPSISISRWPYKEYHTDKDNLDILDEKALKNSKEVILNIIRILDDDYYPIRKFKGLIQFSKYGLWDKWNMNDWDEYLFVYDIMFNLEGELSIFEISQKLDIPFEKVLCHTDELYRKGLIKKVKK